MDAGVFAVAAANRSLLHSPDFIKNETSCRPAIYSAMQLEKYFREAQQIIFVVPRQNHFVRHLSTFITNSLISHKNTIALYNITSYQSEMQY